ncbi:o-succinylbenzoate--CoA ligase [Haloquadratum walsbyi]|nr:o-succinylbenzoate--CoA ligase [Haloquadratum walsbyi]
MMRQWLSQRAETSPTACALIDAETGDEYTFSALDQAVEQLAGRLSKFGVSQSDRVGIILSPQIESALTFYAAARIGATAVPLGHRLTATEIETRLTRVTVQTIVCEHCTERTVFEATAAVDDDISVISVDNSTIDSVDSVETVTSAEVNTVAWNPQRTQLVLFTSGTTGSPKAVKLTAGNILWSAVSSAFRLGIDPNERWLVTLPLHHMGGIAPILRGPLYGMTVVLRGEFDTEQAVTDLHEHSITAVSLVPTMLRRMLNANNTSSFPERLQTVLLGGAPASTTLINRCQGESIPVYPTYGLTETASQVATARPQTAFDNPQMVGTPLLWTDVTIVDESGNPQSAGNPGEIVVEGPTVTPGYASPESMVKGEYGFHTGDIGVLDTDGRLTVINRLDDRIVTGGENVDPGEVATVLESHPDVASAAVVGISDTEWGERVVAAVTPMTGESINKDALRSHARNHLTGFKIPKMIRVTDTLSRTVSGTIDRDAIRELFITDTDGTSEDR